MEEQEKKAEKTFDADAMRKAMRSWRERAEYTDFDEFDTPLRAEVLEEIHRRLRHKEN